MPLISLPELANNANVAYRKAFLGFQRHATRVATLTPLMAGGECFVAKPKGNGVEVVGALRVERLPRDRSDNDANPREPRICVLLESRDIYKPDTIPPSGEASHLSYSTVRMGYYLPVDTKWKALLGIRYDYDFRGARGRHPIFHAQFDNGLLHERSVGMFPNTPEIGKLDDILQGVRVPTANVIGVTALLKLAADHLSLDCFEGVHAEIAALPFFQDWRCDLRTLDDPESPKKMLSWGWYGTKP
jgi:hypothetical protein